MTDVIEKWVAALRSGEFSQGTLALNRNGQYCCLGVLCELAAREGVVEKKEYGSGFGWSAYDGDTTSPTETVLKWAGLPTTGQYPTEVELGGTTAMTLNDEDRRSFAEIADVIENEYLVKVDS